MHKAMTVSLMMFSITGLYHDTGGVSRNRLHIYAFVLVIFIYCCVLYIFHVSDINTPRLWGFYIYQLLIIFISRKYVSLTLLC